mgnify:CR=1 FL=1|jgi:hypothetical protein
MGFPDRIFVFLVRYSLNTDDYGWTERACKYLPNLMPKEIFRSAVAFRKFQNFELQNSPLRLTEIIGGRQASSQRPKAQGPKLAWKWPKNDDKIVPVRTCKMCMLMTDQ